MVGNLLVRFGSSIPGILLFLLMKWFSFAASSPKPLGLELLSLGWGLFEIIGTRRPAWSACFAVIKSLQCTVSVEQLILSIASG